MASSGQNHHRSHTRTIRSGGSYKRIKVDRYTTKTPRKSK